MSINNCKTVFVYKKNQFDSESNGLLKEIKNFLKINIKSIKVFNKYLVKNVESSTFDIALTSVFSEPMVDDYYLDDLPSSKGSTTFAIEYLPGQFDARAEACKQCLLLINPKNEVEVKTAKVYQIKGELSTQDLNKIKKFLINPVDSHEIPVNSTDFPVHSENKKKIEVISGFTSMKEGDLIYLHQSLSLAMTIEDLLMVQAYFRKEKRNPTLTEIKVIDTYWSDHCRHTTFNTKINKVEFEKSKYSELFESTYDEYLKSRNYVYGPKAKTRNICLMDLATIAMKDLKKHGLLKNLDQSDEINACSININVKTDKGIEKYLLMFKNETHNHPTEIEPFGGASTCLGGAIRDPLSGRTYVYQAMRVTGCADPTKDSSNTLAGKLPQRTITISAANGYSSYGNQIGLATGQVEEIYHKNFVAKRLETGAVIACAPKENVVRRAPKVGDVVIIVGGRTGKDGIGGATGSSKQQVKSSITECGAEVQKGNPVEERKIQRLFRNPEASKLIVRCNDFGAGGVSVSIGELCPGIDINLDKVTKKYQGLNGTELAISESQERMAVVVNNKHAAQFIKLANNENLEATIVAKVTNNNRLVMKWNGDTIVNISRDFLNTNGFTQTTDVTVAAPKNLSDEPITNIKDTWMSMLSDLNVSIKTGLIQKFDSTIGANTVLMPLGGVNQLTPAEGMAARIPTFGKKTDTCSLMSFGYNPFLGEWSPFHMAYYSVIESVTKIVAMGGDYKNIYLSFQEYFRKLGKNSKNWGLPFAALLGAYKAQKDLSLAAIGGKDSMSGSFEKLNVPNTLISFAVCVDEAKNIISPEFKKINSQIILLSPLVKADYTLSDKSLISNFNAVKKLIDAKKVISAYSLKQKGVAEGISKMCIGNSIGAKLSNLTKDELFKINYGSLILEISADISFDKELKGLNYKVIGYTTKEPNIVYEKMNIKLSDVVTHITSKFEDVFPSKIENKSKQSLELPIWNCKQHSLFSKVVKKPMVVIPVFPGTNCEYDSQLAFEKAGAIVKQVLIRNMDSKTLLHSINELVKAIDKAHIIFLPGGFSAGDEPDGSAKFIVNVFHNEAVKNATMALIKRKGLILGICNGFQALIKLGLVPYGKIMNMNESMPTLTFNDIRHHMSTIVRTKVVCNKSPWMQGLQPGDVRLNAISHGEGKFVCSKEVLEELKENNQIVTQYVDLNNKATMKTPFNPNGSVYAIEAITNMDGRILGKMGHSERIGTNLYKNIPGEFDQKIFESGVKYFSRGK